MLASALLPHSRFTQGGPDGHIIWPKGLDESRGGILRLSGHISMKGEIPPNRNRTDYSGPQIFGSRSTFGASFSCGFSDLSDITGQMVRRVVGAGAQAGTATIRHLGRLAHVGAVASIGTAVEPITDSADPGSRR